MRVLSDDGCGLWATEIGDGEPLITCHGGPGLWDMFDGLAAMLAPSVRVIRWDQRGCGRSERRGPYSLARSMADLDAVRRSFGVERAALLGHSWGAQLALRYALDHPELVSKLVYVSGTGLGWDWYPQFNDNFASRMGDRLARWADLKNRNRTEAEDRELAVLQWSADFADPNHAFAHAEQMATPWFGINRECEAMLTAEWRAWRETELVAACHGLAIPTMIIDGAEDTRPRWAVDSLQHALPAVKRVVLQNAGHMPWLEAPEEVRSALVTFL
jgi:proline iminopeptidase